MAVIFPLGADAQDTGVPQQAEPVFDLAKTVRESPLLAGSLQVSWNHFGDGLNAHRFEGFADIHTVFRIGMDLTRLDHDQPGQGELKKLDRVVAVLHIPLKKLTIISGIGWEWNQTPENHSGPATYFSIQFHPTTYTTADLVSIHSISDRRYNNETDIGFSAGLKYFRIQGGYRWIHAGHETVSGPSLGLIIRF